MGFQAKRDQLAGEFIIERKTSFFAAPAGKLLHLPARPEFILECAGERSSQIVEHDTLDNARCHYQQWVVIIVNRDNRATDKRETAIKFGEIEVTRC